MGNDGGEHEWWITRKCRSTPGPRLHVLPCGRQLRPPVHRRRGTSPKRSSAATAPAGIASARLAPPRTSPARDESLCKAPNWNGAAAHARGALRLVEDRGGLHDILTRTTSFYEQAMPKPWSSDVAGVMRETLKG
jgi:hypothetical protein